MKKLKLSFMILVLVSACTYNDENVTPTIQMKKSAVWNAEQIGEAFYERMNLNALEDPLKDVSPDERQSFSIAFDKLKGKGSVSPRAVLDEQVEEGKITLAIREGILNYNEDLKLMLERSTDVDEIELWCLDMERSVKDRNDLTDFELEKILTHHAIIRSYTKATLEKFVEIPGARTQGWKSILCYVGCAIDNITAFSSVGALAGTWGEIIGGAVGLVYTIVGGSTACPSCGSTPPPCQYSTAISSPDVCYNTAQGKTFQAYGYGTTPMQFTWQFFNHDNLTTAFHTMATTGDQYVLTNTQLGGRTRIAVRVLSNCSGVELASTYLWFGIADAGRPRPRITVIELGGNQARYTVAGANIGTSAVWSFIPAYRGTLIAGNYNSNTITIQWVSPSMRIGANVTTTSACGTATANAY